MAEIVRRRSWGGVLPLGRHVSISGSSFIQCASASIAPPHPGGAKCYPGAEIQGRTGPSPHAALFSALITGIVSSIASLPLFIPQETRPLAGRLILWSLGISFCALTASLIVTASAIR